MKINMDIFFNIIFGTFAIIFALLTNMILYSKKQIIKAFDKFQNFERITKKDMKAIKISLVDIFYLLIPIPNNSENEFYKNPLIIKKKKEYISLRKGYFLFLIFYTVLFLIVFIFQ